jgi:hypothetical protein
MNEQKMNQLTRLIHGRDRAQARSGMSQAAFDEFHGVTSAVGEGSSSSSSGRRAGEENQQQHEDPDAFRFENAQQELVYAHLDAHKQRVYVSAWASASSVVNLLKDNNDNNNNNNGSIIRAAIPPLIRDLLLLLHEHVPALYEIALKGSRHAAAEAYIRFLECLVGDYLAWRCLHMGVVPFLSELQHMGATPSSLAGVGGGGGGVSVWSMSWLEANCIQQLKQSMQQIWRAYEAGAAAAATTAAAAAAVPFGMDRMVLKFEHGSNSFIFTNERYVAQDFKLQSFNQWLLQRQPASTSARR